ncbi:uncharacterized protein E0L32_009479 [Thyridium curvatum]|uniref:Uncharacterized protein n=1 Tax=Thyridium curvatum TaxID=1093900 RepID=A0A507APG9_9PEZI|nr:uncharacterized protein E0L32_009479 [Thyridium curvatum]TPX09287.1 hypothetical protein E0L32_009479 [Thyridium curvatum]
MCLQHIHVCPICADYIVPVPRCEAAEEADRGTAPLLALPAPPGPPPAAPSPPSLNNGGGGGGGSHHYDHHRHGSSFSDSDETAVDSDTDSFSSSASRRGHSGRRPARFSTASGEQARQRWAGLVTRISCPAFESRNKAAFALCDGCKADMAALFGGGGGGAAGSVQPPHEFPMVRADGYVVWGLIKAE